eukprot:9301641-Pyramimonas_sp.AAC.1
MQGRMCETAAHHLARRFAEVRESKRFEALPEEVQEWVRATAPARFYGYTLCHLSMSLYVTINVS